MNIPLGFARPSMLLWGLGVCLALLIWFRVCGQKRRQRLNRFASPAMAELITANLSPGRRKIKAVLLVLAVYACCVALAGPRYGTRWIEVQQKGIDILFGLDASNSMLAADLQPNRLTRAKLAIRDFVQHLTGDRIGLLPFAGTTFVMCPLTTDYDAFLRSLDAVEPSLLPSPGTDLAAVIARARQVLTNEANHKILILLTDGEDLQGNGLEQARAAAKDGLTIYTVGVGSPQGELIPDPDQPGTFIKDDQGNFVRSRLDEENLRQIAGITGGLYVPLGKMGEGLMRIYQEKLKLVPAQLHQEQRRKQPIERFYLPLALALVLLAMEFLLLERRGTWSATTSFLRVVTKGTPGNRLNLLIVFILLTLSPQQANGSTAADLFHTGQLEKAAETYRHALAKDPDNGILHYNLGDVYYRQKKYDKAASEFSSALQTDDLALQARAYFNLGNTRFQQAKKANNLPEQAEQGYQKAVRAYEASLKLNPDDADAKVNLELAKKKLEQIRKRKKNHNQQQGQEKQDNKQQQNQPDGHSENKQDKEQGRQQGADRGDTRGSTGSPDERKQAQQQDAMKNKEAGGREEKGNKAEQTHNKEKTDQDSGHLPSAEKSGKQMAAGKQSRAMQNNGTMQQPKRDRLTREEAASLLDAMQGEEGQPVFVPAPVAGDLEKSDKNW